MTQIVSAARAAQRVRALAEERRQNPGEVWGIPWGFPTLDHMTGGIQREEMTILIARPGVGKSAIAGQIVLAVALWLMRHMPGFVVRVVSLEMSAETWLKRIACHMADVPIRKIDTGYATQEERERFYKALDEVGRLPIEIIDNEVTLDVIEKFIKHVEPDGKRKCAFWVLDHIGIIPNQGGGDNLAFALGRVSGTLKSLSRYVAPSLILSQMNRKSEERQDKRPTPADVYGADRIVQDARRILGLYREDIYLKLDDEERKSPKPAELLILKANNGELGTVDMIFTPGRAEWKEAPKKGLEMDIPSLRCDASHHKKDQL